MFTVAFGVSVLLGVLLRLWSASPLWLDEALSVNIAKLPLPQMFSALRQDGSPPGYYLLLHLWMAVFGDSDEAVRSLSIACSLAALAVIYLVGRRVSGVEGGRGAVMVLAACPFAIRYATETRMYALVILLTLLGALALFRANERPTYARLALVALLSGLLALTHYWTLFLLASVALMLAFRSVRGRNRGTARKELVAVCCGAVLFAPWLPTFLFQVRHTGTPWASAPPATQFLSTFAGWWGTGVGQQALYLVGVSAIAVALVTGSVVSSDGRTLIAPVQTGPARALAVASLGTVGIGLLISRFGGSGYVLRYSAPALGPAVLLMVLGLRRTPPAVARTLLVTIAAVGLISGSSLPFQTNRTQAAKTAALLRADARSDDLVVYCPDQLGPAVSRLLPKTIVQVTYPSLAMPQRVDWIDYAQRNRKASPAEIAGQLSVRTTGAIWLVRADNYRTFGTQCAQLDSRLAALRGARAVLQTANGHYGESESVIRYPGS